MLIEALLESGCSKLNFHISYIHTYEIPYTYISRVLLRFKFVDLVLKNLTIDDLIPV